MAKFKKRFILVPIAVIVLGLIVYPIISSLLPEDETGGIIAIPVIITNPVKGEIRRELHYPGTLTPYKTVTLVSKVSGKIEHIFVREGDFVTKEQVLVQIENQMVSYQKDQAYSMWQAANAQFARARRGVREEELENTRALVAQAEEDLALAEENFERTKRLYQSGTIARTKYEEAENMIGSAKTSLENARRSLKLMEEGASKEEIAIALANAEAARAQYNLAQLQYDNAILEAPEIGLVAMIMADEGNLVGTSTPIMAIVQIDPIVARIPVPEMHYSRILEKQEQLEVQVFAGAYPDADGFTGTITGISPVIDALSRTFTVDIEISNPRKLLRPGMYVNVEIVIDKSVDTWLLPGTAVVERDGKQVVFVAEEGDPLQCRAVEVVTGIADQDRIEVLSGIGPGDKIIAEGNLFLEDGQQVQIAGQP